MMKKEKELLVAIASQKGGVGKSVFTVLLASVLHYRKGLRVAVVDCDGKTGTGRSKIGRAHV